MIARCKFRVVSETTYNKPGTDAQARTYKLQTQYDASIPEDQQFQKATPYGELSVNISNPNVLPIFQVGNDVYVDISLVPPKPVV
jgi:hypothetical protein